MALPLRKTPEEVLPDPVEPSAAEAEESVLLRWVERPDGRMELLELPLTPELFLDPQLEDKMVQGQWHEETARELINMLASYFRQRPDVLVTHDMKHLFGSRRSAPAPDLSVTRGIRERDVSRPSFDPKKEGTVPGLIVEVVSPMSARVRRTDLEDKVKLYERVGIAEYVIFDAPRRPGGRSSFTLLGYRLDSTGRYQPIEPDAHGRLCSQTTGVAFKVSPDGRRVLLYEISSGRRLLNPAEWEEKAAEWEEKATDWETKAAELEEKAMELKEKASREAEARQSAEERAARAESELARLRGDLKHR